MCTQHSQFPSGFQVSLDEIMTFISLLPYFFQNRLRMDPLLLFLVALNAPITGLNVHPPQMIILRNRESEPLTVTIIIK